MGIALWDEDCPKRQSEFYFITSIIQAHKKKYPVLR